MISFNSDYIEGAVPEILKALTETNYVQSAGYGEDEFCKKAKEKIRKEIKNEDAAIHFLMGGTQTNSTFISSVLRPHEGALCADSAHIAVHETGAVEATGHKVLTLENTEGKIFLEQIKNYVENHESNPDFEHIVKPKLVYLSQPTECGTIYNKKELSEIYSYCKEKNLILYIDGARLGYALESSENDISISELANLCDAFYIGGTKVGALFGEALVITKDELKDEFRYIQKQKGAMLAKGRLLGIQFSELFEDGLYYKISQYANSCAEEIKNALKKKNIPLAFNSPTNQIFPIFTEEQVKKLQNNFVFSIWQRDKRGVTLRFCTDWATKKENVDALIKAIEEL